MAGQRESHSPAVRLLRARNRTYRLNADIEGKQNRAHASARMDSDGFAAFQHPLSTVDDADTGKMVTALMALQPKLS
jgi:hypothetical protein